jgi:hypothetical protein
MTPFERALVELGERGRASIAESQTAAIAIGGNFVGTDIDAERACVTQDLLCIAGEASVDLAMISQVFQAQISCDPDVIESPTRESARMMRVTAAGLARMCARALEIHARDTGYTPDVWFEESLATTELLVSDDRDPLFDGAAMDVVDLARAAASSVFAALACAPADRMGVPGHVASALGTSVAVFMIAEAAGGT